jgi:hypothetical protein
MGKYKQIRAMRVVKEILAALMALSIKPHHHPSGLLDTFFDICPPFKVGYSTFE